MSLGQHLVELRKRLTRGALAIVAGTVGGWSLYDIVWKLIRQPITVIASAHGEDTGTIALNYTSITGAFDIRIQIALTIGIVISSPIWLYQLFAFLVPGLTGREKRYTFGFLFSAIPLFLDGVAAGWLVLQHIVDLMYGFVPAG